MSKHVGNLCSSCFWQLRQLRQIRRSLSDKSAHILVHAFIISRLDYCNAVLHGVTTREQSRLQTVLNASARVLIRTTKFQSISTLLRDSLHWLPISQRVRFKVILMVWNSLLGRSPRYTSRNWAYLCSPINFAVVCDHLSRACCWFQRATPHSCKDEGLPYRDHLNGILFRQQFES